MTHPEGLTPYLMVDIPLLPANQIDRFSLIRSRARPPSTQSLYDAFFEYFRLDRMIVLEGSRRQTWLNAIRDAPTETQAWEIIRNPELAFA
jgi:hypothetical protein